MRGANRALSGHDAVDLGNEPPLSIDGALAGNTDRRRISVQWFSGTILTGLCGAALMGGAVFAALDGVANFAAEPERMEVALRGALGERSHKTDKLQSPSEASAARNIIRVSTTSRVREREVVRVQPFVRVAANFSLSVSELSAQIPRFNPQRLLAESSGAAVGAESANAEPDAEVSFVQRDLAAMLSRIKVATTLPIDAVLARVRDAASQFGPAAARQTTASIPPLDRLAYAIEGTTDPYVGFEARIVPENVTLLPKTSPQSAGGLSGSERAVMVKKGDTIASILRELGARPQEIARIATALGPLGRDDGLKEGQKLRVLIAPAAPGQPALPARVIVMSESVVEAVVALSDLGRYVSVDVQSAETQVADVDEEDDRGGVRLYQSLYETGLRNNIPRLVIDGLVRIYSYDVDFQRRVQPGDSFEVLYAGEDETQGPDTKNDIQFAALTVAGETRRYYRYQTGDDGLVDFYDETGKSAKKFLVRKPLASGIMRSGFGSRKHPILGYVKMHTGVDWAAPTGTPIYSSGNGVVTHVGYDSGYGKHVRIRHANGYETAYGHMTAYARGMEPGTRVRQGQVIGFVGSTGLSTGAHLHYEIIVNGRFVDPMRVRLPRGRVLDGTLLAGFDKGRQQIDAIMARAPARLAQSSPPPRAGDR
ncbi:MAG: LysM peptidoglycan-binding domain-containing M23 family metallopeptidase [Proteobacteria bacterium]|nr:LysM peptidoglycan-binding domain-containing M23 family metallopeptidase [Pseudomonadota bacterium]